MLLLSLIVLAALAAGVVFLAIYIADQLTRSKRHRVQGTPADMGLRYEEVQFLTADRLTLRGWFMESPGARATIVLVHDLEGTRADAEIGLLRLQRDYVRYGYSVFAFDLRGHGESAGKRDSLGRDEQLDVLAAVAYVSRRTAGTQPVILHGFGFGGSLAIAAAARSADVTAVIADSAFLTMRDYLRLRSRHLPGWLLSLGLFFARRVYGGDASQLQPVQAVTHVTVPLLLIHNEGDEVVPVANALNLAAASLDGRDQMWVVPDLSGHVTAYQEATDAYLRQCTEFVAESLPTPVLSARAERVLAAAQAG